MKTPNKVEVVCSEPGCANKYETFSLRSLGVNGVLQKYCPQCREKKLFHLEETERLAKQQEIIERKQRWTYTSGIPLRFRGDSFDNFKPQNNDMKSILDKCKEFVEYIPTIRGVDYKSFIMYSDKVCGLGKTHLVVSIAKRYLERMIEHDYEVSPVLFITEQDMLAAIRSTYNHQQGDHRPNEEELFKKYMTIPLLIIDDVGKEEVADSRFVQRTWFRIVNGRYNNMLPVVLTANHDPDSLAKYLGGKNSVEPTWNRLYEMTHGEIYELYGKSYREIKVDGK